MSQYVGNKVYLYMTWTKRDTTISQYHIGPKLIPFFEKIEETCQIFVALCILITEIHPLCLSWWWFSPKIKVKEICKFVVFNKTGISQCGHWFWQPSWQPRISSLFLMWLLVKKWNEILQWDEWQKQKPESCDSPMPYPKIMFGSS